MKYALLFVSSISLLILPGCSSQPNTAQAAPEVVSGLQIVAVQRTTIPDVVEAVGSVRTAQTTQLAAQVMGNVVAVNVREGDRVRRGQVLVVIDDAQLRAAVERAQAAALAADKDAIAAQSDATLAASTLKRYENLWQKNSLSAQEFDEVKARAQAAQARLELAHAGQQQARASVAQANTQLAYTRVHAPFDGVITEKKADVGMVAAPGMPLLTVEDTHRYLLEVTVDESQASSVKLRAAVPVSLDSLPNDLEGRVAQVVPASDPASHSFVVKLDLPPIPEMRSGQFGRARFPKGTREAIVVPDTAIVERGQLHNLYVVGNDGVASLRYVTVSPVDAKRVEILSGITAGERVIAEAGSRDLAGKVIR